MNEIPINTELHSSHATTVSVDMQQKTVRTKKQPERYGELGNLVLSDNEDLNNSFEAMLSDDSTDEYKLEDHDRDLNTNEFRKRIIHSVARIDPKKRRVDRERLNAQLKTQMSMENFDDEFNEVNLSSKQSAECEAAQCSSRKNKSNNENTDRIASKRMYESDLVIGADSKGIDNAKIGKTSKATGDLVPELLVEILARVRNIEEALMNTDSLPSNKEKAEKGNSFDEFHAFLKSHRLPLQDIDDMDIFEENLDNPEFKKIAV